ncbi:Metallo-dependent phosphatase [Lactarius vividus]|nr:Metallo-dependent phosphatase [Lactarius vividus]
MALLERSALRFRGGDARRLVRRMLFAPDPLVGALRCAWLALVLWAEIGVFSYALAGCRWPVPARGKVRLPALQGDETRRVLLVADAQVPDPRAPLAHTSFLGTGYLAELARAVYVRRAWRATTRLLRPPDVVLFLGDMLKTGRSVRSDDEFAAYVEHFRNFFLRTLEPGVEVRYIPGNADVGLGVAGAFNKHVRQRYERHFGRANQLLAAANHSLVLLDAPGIVDEDYMRAGPGTSFEEWIPLRDGAIEFIKGLAAEEQPGPTVLFSHIPLHRAESKQCGPLRERGTIQRGVGHGWQKTLGKQTSAFLLETLRPAIVFSADDRDYCDVTHTLPGSGAEIHEITVKSFSPARHISRPGFHLLSLAGTPSPAHAHVPCLLPRAGGTFAWLYLPALCLTTLVLVITHMRRANHAARLRLTTPASPLPSHADPKQPPPPPAVPSPYSASSAYSYSYAYSNTPPTGSQPRRDRAPPPPPLPLPPTQEEDEQDEDAVRAHYLYMPPASPVPRDLLARRHGTSPDRVGAPTAATGPPLRAWSFAYAFTFRGRRRRLAVQAPAWWPRRSEAGRACARRRRRREVWSAGGRDMGRVLGPAVVVWFVLLWLY